MNAIKKTGQVMRKKIVVLDDYENSYEKLSDW
ncbi:MAG: hypothetical protein RJA32_1205, partial [Pseudomonadota bacterium]